MPQMYLRQSPEKEMRNTILILLLLMFLPVSVSAQFYTITRDSEILPTERRKESYNRAAKDVTEGKKNKMMVKDTLIVGPDNQKKLENISWNSDRNASLKTELQKKNIAWGSQIRSYVFMPYTMVKDHRTNFEMGNITAVMDGDLDGFINAYLKMKSVEGVE